MPLITIDANLAGTNVNLLDGNNLHVIAGVTISTETPAILVLGVEQRVTVAGSVMSETLGIYSDTANGSCKVTVLDSGLVFGQNAAVTLTGGASRVTNHGDLIGGSRGIDVTARDADYAVIRNFGTIYGVEAIRLEIGTTTARIDIFNQGRIDGDNYGVAATGVGSVVLTNTGTITGGVLTAQGNDYIETNGNIGNIIMEGGDDILIFTGAVNGNFAGLGDGADRYIGRSQTGSLVVDGGAGTDLFEMSAAQETIDGGTGTDLVSYIGSAGGVQVSLAVAGAAQTGGFAAGDQLTGIENLTGSGKADRLTGSAVANNLAGGAGVDTIAGGAGADTIDGSTGRDRLTGGAGNDRFLFIRPSESGDVITDFGRTAGNDDGLQFAAGGGWGGLGTGPLLASRFQTRLDNLAQDADDRFIFRTTDRTLWFDANGNGAGGLTLIADLQAGAVVTAQDIFLI